MVVLKTFMSYPTYTLLGRCHFISNVHTSPIRKINCEISKDRFFTYSACFTYYYDVLKKTSTYMQTRFRSRKSMQQLLDYTRVPKLNEGELEEQFVKGSGPGGQSVNKTTNAVLLKHKPTGIIVKCHESRSLWTNKERAREIMITKLDHHFNGENSIENQQKRLMKKDSLDKARKRNKVLELKKKFKEREGLE